MDPRIERTIHELKNNGWDLKPVDLKLDWWIDEAFELNSVWSPNEVKIYLMLNVDPDTTSNRKKGESIMSVSLSKRIPEYWHSIEQFTFYLSDLNSQGIKKLIMISNDLRKV